MIPQISGADGGMQIHIFLQKKTVGKPTAEFREETHTKNVCVFRRIWAVPSF